MNTKITPANAPKLISVATAVYWVFVGVVMVWHDLRLGKWMQKDGGWIGLILLTGFCGTAFWAMLAPVGIRALKANRRAFNAKKLGKTVWCLSTVPVVLFCLGCVLLLVYYRLKEM